MKQSHAFVSFMTSFSRVYDEIKSQSPQEFTTERERQRIETERDEERPVSISAKFKMAAKSKHFLTSNYLHKMTSKLKVWSGKWTLFVRRTKLKAVIGLTGRGCTTWAICGGKL